MNLIKCILEPYVLVFRYWEIFIQFTKRSIEVQHKGSHLGLLWSVVQPLLLLCVYVSVFGFIYGGQFNEGESRFEFGLNIFIGIIGLHLVSEILAASPISIISNPSFVKKVVFPLEILPVSIVAASLFHFLIGLSLVAMGILLIGVEVTWSILFFPLILIPVTLLSIGVSWIISSLGVFFRDVVQIVPFLSVVLLFSSAIFYSPKDIPSNIYNYIKFNPILQFVDLTRCSLLGKSDINWEAVSYLYLLGVFVFQIGYIIFIKLRPGFSDVV